MATKLSAASIERAINHLCRYGDTDIFPHAAEIVFLHEKKKEIIDFFLDYTVENFKPLQAMEALAPKSRYGFRTAHQLNYIDVLVFTAAAIEVGADLENLKTPLGGFGPFAYRFEPSASDGLFLMDHGYQEWIVEQQKMLAVYGKNYKEVVATDIADFYARIYSHRVENNLDMAVSIKPLKYLLERIIGSIRSKQSHGIPVGGSASRIIAEISLADVDSALLQEGFDFTRFVDDYRILIKKSQNAYGALALLAELLSVNEGMNLNSQKTIIWSVDKYAEFLTSQSKDIDGEAHEAAENMHINDIYFDGKIDDKTISYLKSFNLQEMLDGELNKEFWEFGKIRTILRAMRFCPSAESLAYILSVFDKVMPFIKDVVLLFDEMKDSVEYDEKKLVSLIFEQINLRSGASVLSIRTWLLEFGVRQIVNFDYTDIRGFPNTDALDRRQSYYLLGLQENRNFFRSHKTKFEEKSALEKSAFMLGATCLPKDELDAWIKAIKPNMNRPLELLFCDWLKTKSGQLESILNQRTLLATE